MPCCENSLKVCLGCNWESNLWTDTLALTRKKTVSFDVNCILKGDYKDGSSKSTLFNAISTFSKALKFIKAFLNVFENIFRVNALVSHVFGRTCENVANNELGNRRQWTTNNGNFGKQTDEQVFRAFLLFSTFFKPIKNNDKDMNLPAMLHVSVCPLETLSIITRPFKNSWKLENRWIWKKPSLVTWFVDKFNYERLQPVAECICGITTLKEHKKCAIFYIIFKLRFVAKTMNEYKMPTFHIDRTVQYER